VWDRCTMKVLRVSADDESVMPNLYFCQPHAQNQGMLRAVISVDDCSYLVAPGSATYLGEEFPKVRDESGRTTDFAVLSVSASEANSQWRRGYYRFDADLMELNAQLLKIAR
jgi:hypothetical protein